MGVSVLDDQHSIAAKHMIWLKDTGKSMLSTTLRLTAMPIQSSLDSNVACLHGFSITLPPEPSPRFIPAIVVGESLRLEARVK